MMLPAWWEVETEEVEGEDDEEVMYNIYSCYNWLTCMN